MIGAIGRGFAYFGTFIQWKLSPRLPNVSSQIVCHQTGGRNIPSLKEIDEGNEGGYKNLFQGRQREASEHCKKALLLDSKERNSIGRDPQGHRRVV